VVAVHRIGEAAGRPYLVSEYVDGDPIEKLAKPVAWQRALEIGLDLARGFGHVDPTVEAHEGEGGLGGGRGPLLVVTSVVPLF